MTVRKSLINGALLIFLIVIISACKTIDLNAGVSPRLPMTICIDSRWVYSEIDKETLDNLHLSVDSCDGLIEVGKIDDAGREYNRAVYEKKGQKPLETMVIVPETAYAHPDPRYPNLVVALLDGEPAIFEFCNFTGSGYHPEAGERIAPGDLVAIYGLTSPEAIREIRVSSQEEDQDVVLKATITDQAEIQRFLDVLQNWDDWGWPARGHNPDTEYPRYYVEGELANGFSFTFYLTSKEDSVEWANFWFTGSEALIAWIESHVKSSE